MSQSHKLIIEFFGQIQDNDAREQMQCACIHGVAAVVACNTIYRSTLLAAADCTNPLGITRGWPADYMSMGCPVAAKLTLLLGTGLVVEAVLVYAASLWESCELPPSMSVPYEVR